MIPSLDVRSQQSFPSSSVSPARAEVECGKAADFQPGLWFAWSMAIVMSLRFWTAFPSVEMGVNALSSGGPSRSSTFQGNIQGLKASLALSLTPQLLRVPFPSLLIGAVDGTVTTMTCPQ